MHQLVAVCRLLSLNSLCPIQNTIYLHMIFDYVDGLK